MIILREFNKDYSINKNCNLLINNIDNLKKDSNYLKWKCIRDNIQYIELNGFKYLH